MPAAAVAEAMCRAIEKDKPELTLTAVGKAVVLANRFAPWALEWYFRREFRPG